MEFYARVLDDQMVVYRSAVDAGTPRINPNKYPNAKPAESDSRGSRRERGGPTGPKDAGNYIFECQLDIESKRSSISFVFLSLALRRQPYPPWHI